MGGRGKLGGGVQRTHLFRGTDSSVKISEKSPGISGLKEIPLQEMYSKEPFRGGSKKKIQTGGFEWV